jgi:hypothetical protein
MANAISQLLSGDSTMSRLMRMICRLGHWIMMTAATLWLLIDIVFLAVIRPIREHIMRWRWMQAARTWVCALGPYASLAVFVIPLIILEPVKPVGAFLFHRHHHMAATSVIVAGELAKLAIVDQLFDMTKPKLLTLPWFAWAYGRWRAIIDTLRALPIRRMVHEWVLAARRRLITLR